jgi:hypothetical protein
MKVPVSDRHFWQFFSTISMRISPSSTAPEIAFTEVQIKVRSLA